MGISFHLPVPVDIFFPSSLFYCLGPDFMQVFLFPKSHLSKSQLCFLSPSGQKKKSLQDNETNSLTPVQPLCHLISSCFSLPFSFLVNYFCIKKNLILHSTFPSVYNIRDLGSSQSIILPKSSVEFLVCSHADKATWELLPCEPHVQAEVPWRDAVSPE